jgi:hypothetical protein
MTPRPPPQDARYAFWRVPVVASESGFVPPVFDQALAVAVGAPDEADVGVRVLPHGQSTPVVLAHDALPVLPNSHQNPAAAGADRAASAHPARTVLSRLALPIREPPRPIVVLRFARSEQ